MGLDMYLYRKTYVRNWDHYKPEQRTDITVTVMGKNHPFIKPERISEVTEEIAYWRKFNALHNWFVTNCGDGRDECQKMIVKKEDLVNLLEALEKVREILNNSKPAIKVLTDWNGVEYEEKIFNCGDEILEIFPPVDGFFFGSTEIDEYFQECVEDSIKSINMIFIEDEVANNGYLGEYFYQASW